MKEKKIKKKSKPKKSFRDYTYGDIIDFDFFYSVGLTGKKSVFPKVVYEYNGI